MGAWEDGGVTQMAEHFPSMQKAPSIHSHPQKSSSQQRFQFSALSKALVLNLGQALHLPGKV
jgi:hypothetical protein